MRRAGHVTRTGRYSVSTRRATTPLALMADFAQGLDASKLILAETVRSSNFSATFVVTSAPALVAALIHHQPFHCPSVQLSPLSLWSIRTREPRCSPSLTSSGKFIFSLLTFIHTERTTLCSSRVIYRPPLSSTSSGSPRTTRPWS
jgi:hypothetical protein